MTDETDPLGMLDSNYWEIFKRSNNVTGTEYLKIFFVKSL